MSKLAIIKNGIVTNVIIGEEGSYTPQAGETVAIIPDGFGRNDLYDGVIFTKPVKDLAERKTQLLRDLNGEGLTRVQAVFPSIQDINMLDLEIERWLSIAPAARSPVADYQSLIDVVTAWRQARTTIKAFSTALEVDGYNVQTDPSWPV